MNARPIPIAHPSRSIRAAMLWIALLVALVSALPGGGLPRTIQRGSAFDPATSEVLVQPLRAAARLTVPTLRPDDGPAPGADRVAVLVTRDAIPRAPLRAARPGMAPRALAAIPPHPPFDGSPRGPPLA